MVFTTVQLLSTKPEFRLCADSNFAHGVSEVYEWWKPPIVYRAGNKATWLWSVNHYAKAIHQFNNPLSLFIWKYEVHLMQLHRWIHSFFFTLIVHVRDKTTTSRVKFLIGSGPVPDKCVITRNTQSLDWRGRVSWWWALIGFRISESLDNILTDIMLNQAKGFSSNSYSRFELLRTAIHATITWL